MSQLIPLTIPPGIYKNGTEYQSKGRYYDSNLVRFFEGTMRPLGGWRRVIGGVPRTELQVSGSPRGAHAWRSNDDERYLAIGTHTHLYVYGSSVTGVQDISPVDLVPGFADNNVNAGFGGGIYGYDTYGTPRTAVNITDYATTWSFDNFGEFLVAVSSEDGRLFYWDLLTATAMEVVATSGTTPTQNTGVLVTDERFVFLLQADGNRRRIAWSDQEDLFNWEITATTQAGDFELSTPGEIMAAVKVRGQALIITSTDAHTADYLGPPLVYGFERIGTGCGCVSRNAAVSASSFAMWMNDEGFKRFDGSLQDVPCTVSDHVFSRINRGQLHKVWAVHANDYGEITWYYPVGTEVDSYVTYNYREDTWTIGSLDRTIGVDNNVFPKALRLRSDGYLYEHEVGFDYEGATPFCQSGPVEMGNGDMVYMSRYLYPDEKTQGDVRVRFATRFYPNAPEYPHGPYTPTNPTSIRFTGRQVALKVEGVSMSDWRVGTLRLDVEPGGMR